MFLYIVTMSKLNINNRLFKTIAHIAQAQQTEVYLVGGYVRDKMLGCANEKDIDFVVVGDGLSFAEKAAQALKAQKVAVYKRFGTAMIRYRNRTLEFVGARNESYRGDSRKPQVTPADLMSDLTRRDFTINAMAVSLNYDTYGQIVDPFQGRQDLKNSILRTPLDAQKTFYDDPLRILRAARFAAQLDFTIEENTKKALKTEASRLKIISQERITEELKKMLVCQKPSIAFHILDKTGILDIILPEIAQLKGVDQIGQHRHKDVFYHTLQVVDNIAKSSDNVDIRIVALYHDVAKPLTKNYNPETGWTFHGHDDIGARMFYRIGKRLRLSTSTIDYVQKMIRLHLRPIHLSEEGVTDSAIRRLVFDAGEDIDDLILLCRADITSGNRDKVRQHLANFDYVVKRIAEVEEKDRLRNFQPPVRGDEIMSVLDISPGPIVGKIKKSIEEAILNGNIPNEHDAAFDYMMKIKDNFSSD